MPNLENIIRSVDGQISEAVRVIELQKSNLLKDGDLLLDQQKQIEHQRAEIVSKLEEMDVKAKKTQSIQELLGVKIMEQGIILNNEDIKNTGHELYLSTCRGVSLEKFLESHPGISRLELPGIFDNKDMLILPEFAGGFDLEEQKTEIENFDDNKPEQKVTRSKKIKYSVNAANLDPQKALTVVGLTFPHILNFLRDPNKESFSMDELASLFEPAISTSDEKKDGINVRQNLFQLFNKSSLLYKFFDLTKNFKKEDIKLVAIDGKRKSHKYPRNLAVCFLAFVADVLTNEKYNYTSLKVKKFESTETNKPLEDIEKNNSESTQDKEGSVDNSHIPGFIDWSQNDIHRFIDNNSSVKAKLTSYLNMRGLTTKIKMIPQEYKWINMLFSPELRNFYWHRSESANLTRLVNLTKVLVFKLPGGNTRSLTPDEQKFFAKECLTPAWKVLHRGEKVNNVVTDDNILNMIYMLNELFKSDDLNVAKLTFATDRNIKFVNFAQSD